MGETRDPAVEALLVAIRADFAARLPFKTGEIVDLIERGAWSDARRAAHRLRGSAATHGFEAVGTRAGALEDALRAAVEDPARLRVLSRALADAAAQVQRPGQGER